MAPRWRRRSPACSKLCGTEQRIPLGRAPLPLRQLLGRGGVAPAAQRHSTPLPWPRVSRRGGSQSALPFQINCRNGSSHSHVQTLEAELTSLESLLSAYHSENVRASALLREAANEAKARNGARDSLLLSLRAELAEARTEARLARAAAASATAALAAAPPPPQPRVSSDAPLPPAEPAGELASRIQSLEAQLAAAAAELGAEKSSSSALTDNLKRSAARIAELESLLAAPPPPPPPSPTPALLLRRARADFERQRGLLEARLATAEDDSAAKLRSLERQLYNSRR